MPRYEPAINQFIGYGDPFTIAAGPPKPKRAPSNNIVNPTRSHKKKGSISALERLAVFAEATQRVKRRLRNVIAGAVGASASQPRRKSRDAMNVDYVWNGYFDHAGFPISQPVASPANVEDLPNYAPVVNRYSVNMEEMSISDVSMYWSEGDKQDDSAPTPRATTPEPSTPVATPKKKLESEVKNKNDEDENDGEGSDDENSRDEEQKSDSPHKSKKESEKDESEPTPKAKDDAASILSPMDEDTEDSPSTPKHSSPAPVPVIKTPKPPRKRSGSGSSEDSVSSTKTTRPSKNPKLTLDTTFARTPVDNEVKTLTRIIDGKLTASPEGLGLQLAPPEIPTFNEQDFMEIIPPSALPGEAAPPYTLDQPSEGNTPATVRPRKPTLLPAVEISEKKPTRRSSRDSDTTIVGSPKRETAFHDEKKGDKDDLSRSLDTPTTIRAKIDALPLESHNNTPMVHTPTFRIWPVSPIANRNSEGGMLTVYWSRRPLDA